MALVPEHRKPSFQERFTHARMSWHFIIFVSVWIGSWIAWNLLPGFPHFDPYVSDGAKFDLLNLLMSVEQCISNPVIWMGMGIAMAADRAVLIGIAKDVRAIAARVEQQQAQLIEIAGDVEAIAVEVAEE